MGRYKMNAYQMVWRKRSLALKESGKLTPTQAAEYLVAQARSRVPVKEGRLRASLRRDKNIVRIATGASWSVNGFPYALWINKTAGFEQIELYGKVPSQYGRTPSGFRWTGQAGFWDMSIKETVKIYPKLVHTATIRALTVQ